MMRLVTKITQQLNRIEKLFLLTLTVGAILSLFTIDSSRLIQISFVGLSIVFLLYVYKHLEIPGVSDEKHEFKELFAWTILPKVMWLGNSISAIGILFFFLDFENDGYKYILIMGGLVISVTVFILIFLFTINTKHLIAIVPILFRAVPLLLFDYYLLFR